jgi:hypothetical protein
MSTSNGSHPHERAERSGEAGPTITPRQAADSMPDTPTPVVFVHGLFDGRGHSLTIDSGWKDVADAVLGWLGAHGL